MRYRWEIRTGDTWYAGTDANVFLSLTGDRNSMKEMEINDPDTNNDWEKGDINHGAFETADLGNINTGTLRHDGSGAGPDWTVDYVKITNDEDGRVWLAGVNTELKSNQPFRLVFSLTDRGQYDELQRRKAEEAARKKQEADDAVAKSAEEEEDRAAAEEERQFRKELENQKKQLQRELQKAKMQAELDKLRAQLGQTSGTQPPTQTGGMRTVELFGVVNGSVVPLTRAVTVGSGGASIAQGARVMRGDAAGDGFGLGGSPGRWAMYYGGTSPADFGLPPNVGVLGSDGSRGWVLNGEFLRQLFGSSWMQVIS